MTETVEVLYLTITYTPQDPDVLRWLMALVEEHGDRVPRRKTLDRLIVTLEGDEVTIPAIVFPTDAFGEFKIDLYGGGAILPLATAGFNLTRGGVFAEVETDADWAAYANAFHQRNAQFGLSLTPKRPFTSSTARMPSALVSVAS